MDYKNRASNYEKFPFLSISDEESLLFEGFKCIAEELIANVDGGRLILDCYPGINEEELISGLGRHIKFDHIFRSEDIFYEKDTLNVMMRHHLTDDRVRGVMYYGKLADFVDFEKFEEMRKAVSDAEGITLVCGVGASLVSNDGILVYCDISRWEIQLRYRNGMPNFKQDNYNEDVLRKYKRGYFIEWRIADKHKRELFDRADYWFDGNKVKNPKMISGETFRKALRMTVSTPFRTVPYFDPGVWGGQWMKKVCGLDENEKNYAWSFDGVPEENSLLLRFGSKIMEIPSINAVLYYPVEFLGEQVYARFGADFPIRFDFLDTFEGQNLSLQVHPTVDFIKSEYGMPYTQEESYYILDAATDAAVYLGVKDGADREAFFSDLESADRGEISFDAEKYVNVYKAKKHDHFLIPPGTLHCSGKNCMVLEISTSAYIFTFKLWDWDRLGLDGLPRPIHIREGKAVLNFDYNTIFAENELINRFETLHKDEHLHVEKTGLHRLEFLETKRFTFNNSTLFDTGGNVQMMNLVDGDEVEISSIDGSFKPMRVHYAETFIIPASVGKYLIRPCGISHGRDVMILQAYLKNYR